MGEPRTSPLLRFSCTNLSPPSSERLTMRVITLVAFIIFVVCCSQDVRVVGFVPTLQIGRAPRHKDFSLLLQNWNVADVSSGTPPQAAASSLQSKTRMLSPIQRSRSTVSRGSPMASINLGSKTRNNPKTRLSSTVSVEDEKLAHESTNTPRRRPVRAGTLKNSIGSQKGKKTWTAGSLSLREEMLQHRLLTKEEEMELGSKVSRAVSLLGAISTLLEDRILVARKGGRDVSMDMIPDLTKLSAWKDLVKQNKHDRSSLQESPYSLLSLLTNEDVVVHLGVEGGVKELQEVINDALMAQKTLIECNLKLVLSISKKWLRRSILSSTSQSSSSAASEGLLSRMYANGGWDIPSLDEVVQEGVLGLSRAVEKYDPERGVRFSTYATHWITSFVRACLTSALTGSLRVPAALHEIKQSYWRVVKNAYLEGDSPPTEEEAAELIGVTTARLRSALAATKAVVSIDAPLVSGMSSKGSSAGGDALGGSGVQLVLADTLECQEKSPEELVDLSFLRQCLENAMAAELSPHERDVIRLRLGLDDGQSRTAREVVAVCGGAITMADVRTAERRAYKKLRSPNAVHTYDLLSFLDPADLDYCTYSRPRF